MGLLTTRKGCQWPLFLARLRRLYGRLFNDRFLSGVSACCLLGLMLAAPAANASACTTYDKAMADCNTTRNSNVNDPNWIKTYSATTCSVGGNIFYPKTVGYTVTQRAGGTQLSGAAINFTCPPGLCPIDSSKVYRMMPMSQYGDITKGGPHMADGICDAVFISGAALNGMFRGTSQNTGKYIWETNQPTPGPDAPGANPPCATSDLLCFNPGDGSVCGNVGTEKICTSPGATKPPPNAGSCTAGSGNAVGSWICGGSPDAPRPIDKQGNLVPDSAKIADQHGTVIPGGGAPSYDFDITLHNTNPNNTGGPSNTPSQPVDTNQGKSDKDGHCPDGSTPSAGGCNAGYSDNGCDMPPSCSGDALLCGQLRESHRAACDSRKFMEDTGATFKPTELDEIVNQFSPIEWEGDVAWNGKIPEGCSKGADGAVNCAPGSAGTDPVNADVPKLEVKRFWGGRAQCPGIPEFTLHGQTSDMSVNACKTTGYLGDIILAGAYILAAIAFARSMSNGG